MKDKILEIIKQYENGVDVNTMKNALNIKDMQDFKAMIQNLCLLEDEGKIINIEDRFNLIEREGYFQGILEVKKGDFGFVLQETDDIFVRRHNFNSAQDGDLVFGRILKRDEGEIIKVVNRKRDYVIGKLIKKKNVYIIACKDKSDIEFIVKGEVKAKEGSIVKADITRYKGNYLVECKISEVLGQGNSFDVVVKEEIINAAVSSEFPIAVKNELESIPDEVSIDELKDRLDLTNDLIFTIDGDDAKDFDDAVSLTKDKYYTLGVHIADVSYYVKDNTALNTEALNRGTSIYLANQVIPMLPFKLSNGICSLNPNVIRLTLSCIIRIDFNGNILGYEIKKSAIKSKYRMTYNKVNAILKDDEKLVNEYQEIVSTINDMYELAQILKKRRESKGSINFETKEIKFKLTDGVPTDIVILGDGISEGIIEEFMILANEMVATYFMTNNLPFVYRIHEKPDYSKLEELKKIVNNFELKSLKKVDVTDITLFHFQNLLKEAKEKGIEPLINTLALRTMQKARYQTKNVGHYGLALVNYSHFTSPIRRYPDLIGHRVIHDLLFKENETKKEYYDTILDEISLKNSLSEKVAVDLERNISDIAAAYYMESKTNDIYRGIISTIMSFGMFVELENTIDGLISNYTLPNYFEYQENKKCYYDNKNHITYSFGDIVLVKVQSVIKEEGKINFTLIKKVKP